MLLKRHSGFTLMELLVAISLMVLIMGIVAMIFHQSSRVYQESTDIWTIYNTAAVACDYLANDLNGCFPLDNGQQLFSLTNGGEDDEKKARDEISFRATVSVGGKVRGGEVVYKLVEDTDPSVQPDKGGSKKTVITKRTLYALRRIVKDFDGTLLATNDVCHYVLSFNIEYYDRTSGTYRQITDLSPPKDKFTWPIGDNNPEGETIHSGLRISLRVVAGASELKERMFSGVIWIPMGK